MGRNRRNPPGGYVYHVLNRANRRQTLFANHNDYEGFLQVVRETLIRHPIRILDYCIMPNHWHFMIWPEKNGQLAAFMHYLTATHATRWNIAHGLGGTGHVYQGGYKYFPVETDDHYFRAKRYVVRNALRACLVERAEHWRWSSLWLPAHFALCEGPLAVGSDWLNWVNEAPSDEELASLRRAVHRGSPFGNPDWQEQVALELDLMSTLRRRGRPSKCAALN